MSYTHRFALALIGIGLLDAAWRALDGTQGWFGPAVWAAGVILWFILD